MIVASRWAMTSIVVPAKHSLMVWVILESISKSTDDVAGIHSAKLSPAVVPATLDSPSSMTKILDFFNNARARHKSCFSPALKFAPSASDVSGRQRKEERRWKARTDCNKRLETGERVALELCLVQVFGQEVYPAERLVNLVIVLGPGDVECVPKGTAAQRAILSHHVESFS